MTNDVEKIPFEEYFNGKFFNKNKNDFVDGINEKYNEFSMKDVEEIARKINKIEEPKVIDYALDIINETFSSNIKNFTFFNENNQFYFVCFNDNENQIEIYKENNLKYSKNEEKKIIKIKEKINNVNDVLIFENYVLILSSPICCLNIKKNFEQNFINKKNIFSKFITIENKKIIVYLNEKNEIGSFEFEIYDETNELKIIKEDSFIKIENFEEKINEFDCFKTSKNDILIYFYSDNLIHIYNLINKKLIFSKKIKENNIIIISLLLTEIDNKIFVIYLTSTKQERKQLIDILIFKYENFNEKLLILNDPEKKFIAHKENRKMEKIALFYNNQLIIKTAGNFHLYDLKKNIFYAYSNIGKSYLDNFKLCYHFFYGNCILGLRYLSNEKKIVNLFYLRDFSCDYFKLKGLVIKKIAGELFHYRVNEFICLTNKYNVMEMNLVERLMILNDEENEELYKLIEEKKKQIQNNIDIYEKKYILE